MYPPATYIFVQSMVEEMTLFSKVREDLKRIRLDLNKLTITDDNLLNVFHPTAEYHLVNRTWSSTADNPDVLFIDGLNVQGSRGSSFGKVKFSTLITYNSTNKDFVEDHDFWEERISPELKRLENYLLGVRANKLNHPYRTIDKI